MVLEVTVSCFEGNFPFMALFNSHPMVGPGKIQLGELFGPA